MTGVFTEPSTARQEAERLVAAALAFASLAANAHPELATGSAACCVCPFCKLIEAVRDPDPQFVERLATGAGDLAVGVAGLLRNLAPPTRTNPSAAGEDDADGDPWRAATTARPAGGDPDGSATSAAAAAPVKKVAKKAVAKKVVAKKAAAERSPEAPGEPVPTKREETTPADAAKAAKPQAAKAVAKKAVNKAMPKPRPRTTG